MDDVSIDDLIDMAERGDIESAYLAGKYYLSWFHFDKDPDIPNALLWLNKAVSGGHAKAHTCLASLYIHGDGVDRDFQKGIELLFIAADMGCSRGQYNLAKLLHYGFPESRDVLFQKDLHLAFSMYLKSALQGDKDSQFALGKMYAAGEGCKADIDMAEAWFMKCAENHDVDMQYYIALMFADGEIVRKNSHKAKVLHEMAANDDFELSQHCLGEHYYHGDGCDIDYEKAFYWFERSAAWNLSNKTDDFFIKIIQSFPQHSASKIE